MEISEIIRLTGKALEAIDQEPSLPRERYMAIRQPVKAIRTALDELIAAPAVAGRAQGEEHMRWADFKEVLNIQDLLEEWQDKYVATHENGSWPENWERDWSGWIAGKIVETTLRESAREAPSEPKERCAAERFKNGTPGGGDPVDCDYPFCGCFEQARIAVEALIEIGWKSPEQLRREEFPEAPAAPKEK